MKNNQFKKYIREYIENTCKELKLNPIYVDISNNERVIYLLKVVFIKDKESYEHTVVGTINTYLTNEKVRIRYSTNCNKVVSICNKSGEIDTSYMEIESLFSYIDKMFDDIVSSNFVLLLEHKKGN